MAVRSHGSVRVVGMSNVLAALTSVGVEARDLRGAMREGSKLMRDGLRAEAPKLSGSLARSSRAGAARNRATARIGGTEAVPYARWQALAKKSPHRHYHLRALHGTKAGVARAIAQALQRLIDRHELNN